MTHEEYAKLRPKDVVLYRGRYRPIVSVSHVGVTFPILRCSWTDRPLTTVLKGEIVLHGSVTGLRVKAFVDEEYWALLEKENREIAEGNPRNRMMTCSGGVTANGRRFLKDRVSSSCASS